MNKSRKIINTGEQIQALRKLREEKCFHIINRGKLWYDTLTLEQKSQLRGWYFAWLNVTETFVIPKDIPWLKNKISDEEIY